MRKRYVGFKARGRGGALGKYHLVDRATSVVDSLGDQRALCGLASGDPYVKDASKVDCKRCIDAVLRREYPFELPDHFDPSKLP